MNSVLKFILLIFYL